jgi:hypothetical protein
MISWFPIVFAAFTWVSTCAATLRCVLEDAGCIAAIAAPGHNPAAAARLLEAVRGLTPSSSARGVVVVDVSDLLNGVQNTGGGGGGGGGGGDRRSGNGNGGGGGNGKGNGGGTGAAESESSSEDTTRLRLDPSPGKLSHVFFTSGSTGRPKGCLATHGALAHYCRAKNHAHEVGLYKLNPSLPKAPGFNP